MPIRNIEEISLRKQEILDAAKTLFSSAGYGQASMRDIANQLGIKPPSLYSHYKSKEDILWEIAVRCARDFHAEVLPIAQSEEPPAERLRLMVHAHSRIIIRNIDAAAIFFREWQSLTGERHQQFAKLIEEYEHAFEQVLREGMLKGTFRTVPTRFTTVTILSSINWIQYWYKPEGSMTPEDIAANFEQFVMQGLFSKA